MPSEKILLLPRPDIGDWTFRTKDIEGLFNRLDSGQIQKNLDYIGKVYKSIPQKAGIIRNMDRVHLFNLYREYHKLLRDYRKILKTPDEFIPADTSLSNELPSLEVLGTNDTSLLEIENNIIAKARESSTNESLVFISPSHATTYSLVKAIKRSDPNAKLGLLVFDEHTDLYLTKGDINAAERLGDPHLNVHPKTRKSNFLWKLLRDKDLGASVIIGPTSDGKKLVENNTDEKDDYAPTHSVAYKQIQNNLLIASSRDVNSKAKLRRVIKKHMDFFKQHDITNILFSVDIDSLSSTKLGLTTSEYNPLMNLLVLSLFDFTKIYSNKTPSQKAALIRDALDNPPRFTQLLKNPDSEADKSIVEKAIKLKTIEGDLSLDQVLITISEVKRIAASLGITVGANLYGSRVLCDITEVSLPDYNGNTAKTVVKILNEIKK